MESEGTIRATLPKVSRLEDPDGYQVWQRDMRTFLIQTNLWRYTLMSESIFPPRVTQADVDLIAARNAAAQLNAEAGEPVTLAPIPEIQTVAEYEAKREKWENRHLIACNSMTSCLGTNYYNDYKDFTNACFLWVAIKENCKPKGSGSLNDRYRQLMDLKLKDCKDASEYAGKFKELHNEIRNMHESLRLNENFLVFLFHAGLGKEHEDYFLHYSQNHGTVDEAGKASFTLEYATRRFIQTVTNASVTRSQSNSVMVATRESTREAYIATNGPVAYMTVIEGQDGAVEGPNAEYIQRLVKSCRHCHRLYHTEDECDQLGGKRGSGHSNRRKRSHSRSRRDRDDGKRHRSGRDQPNRRDRDRDHRTDRRSKHSKPKGRKSREERAAHPAYYDTEPDDDSVSSGTDDQQDCYVAVINEKPECYVSIQEEAPAHHCSINLDAMVATTQEKPWGLDSCCSIHMTGYRSLFQSYRLLTEDDKDDLRPVGGIGGQLLPVGKGKVELKMNVKGQCRSLYLDEVLHFPGLPMNLMSKGRLMRLNCPMKIVPGGIEVGSQGITAWLSSNDIFKFEMWGDRPVVPKPPPVKSRPKRRAMIAANPPANPVDGPIPSPVPARRRRSVSYESDVTISSATDCNSGSDSGSSYATARSASSQSDSGISDCEDPRLKKKRKPNPATIAYYHRCLGHSGDVLQLENYGIDLSKKVSDKEPCVACTIKKMKQVKHTSHIRPGKRPMELIHSDIGQMKETKLGYKYFITFMDDYTKRSEIEIISEKSQAFEAFKRYLLRNERGDLRCRRLRTDWGGEYEKYAFDRWRAENGIMWEPIVPHNPEQNGAAERLNQDLKSCVNTVMEETGLSNELWPQLILAANYLRNRRPTQTRKLTPYEAHTGCKPNLKHLRPLGSYGWCIARKPNTGWVSGQDRTITKSPGRLVNYDGDHIYKLLLDDGRIYRTSQVIWGKVPPKFLRLKLSEPSAVGGTSHSNSQPAKDLTTAPIEIDLDLPVPPVPPAVPMPPAPPAMPMPSQQPILTPAGSTPPTPPTPVTISSSSQTPSASTTVGDALLHHPYLQDRDLSPDPIALLTSIVRESKEPKTYEEATSDNNPYREEWVFATEDEIESLLKNGTWELVDCPKDRKPLRGKWVFTLKRGSKGEVIRHKARWVVLGCSQREGLDYNETFASVVKPMSYKALFALAAALNWDIEQMDVKTAFLYGDVEEIIFVMQPTGFKSKKYPNKVCKLKKALYGLKQSPRVWYNTFASFMKELGFHPIDADYSVFIDPRTGTIVALYVDDVLITGPNRADIQRVKDALNGKFHMTDLGPIAFYLGMTVVRDRANRTIRLGQAAYVERVLRDNGMWDAKSISTPMETSVKLVPAEDGFQATPNHRTRYQSAVGSLMYAMLGTRPDLAFAVSVVSRYAHNPTPKHWGAVKRIFAYLKGTVNMQLTFQGPLSNLVGYTDSDWAGDTATRRSTSGYVFNVGSAAISWSSKRQATVALSTCEAEYVGQTQAAKEAIWLRSLLTSLRPGSNALETVIIYGDNQGAIALAKDPRSHGRTKHIDIANHFCRERVADKSVAFEYTPTDKQVADGLTKPLPRDKFEAFRSAIGLY